MTGSPITFAGHARPSSAPTQTMSDTDTRGESRRTDDEAVTLPIPTSGLLSSPTQVGCHSARFTGGTPTPESHFNLAPLLSRGILSTGRSPRGQTTTHTAADGAVLPSGSPRRWPTPSHSLREFGHMPSLACSSGGNQSASGRRSSCSTGAVTVAGMLVGAVCKEESSEALLVDSGGSECFGDRQRAPDSRRLWDQEHQALGAEAEPDVAQRLHLEDAESSAQILQIVSDGQELHTYHAGGDQYLANICMGDDDAVALDQDHHPAELGESSSLMHNPASCVTGDGVSAAVEEEEADEDASSRDVGCVIRGGPGGPKGEWEGPPWLTAEECAVTDAITQLQAVVSGLSEPYQRYIRERALELTRIIDENLQRQGLEPVTHGAVAGIATPSKKAATAAAALVLAVAASGTRWPYSTTPSGGDGSAGGGGGGGAAASWPHIRPGRTADGSFHSTELAGHGSATSADSMPFRGALGGGGGVMIGAQAQTLSYGGLATSGSCTLCFGSVLGNSQARPTESADQISGAVSAQAASASQHALSSSRATPRSRSYSSYYAQQQSQRRLASLRANGGLEPASASAMSSACSNPYGIAQPQDNSAGAVTSRRVPPRPPPRGLGCGLGQPRKLVSEGSRPTANVHIHNLPYMMLPHSENPTPVGTARDHYRPGTSAREHYISTSSAREHYSNISTASAREHYTSTASAREYYNPVSSYRRSRMSSQQSDQQQQHDQEELISGDTSQTPSAQQKPHCVGAQRRGVGRPTSGNAAMLRPGSNASNGHAAKNANTGGHVNIRPAAVVPPNYQPPWQRPPPARTSASGSDRQRPADIAAELQQKNRKAPPKAGLAKAAQGTVAQQAAQPSRGVAARKHPPALQQQQHPRPASDYEDDISMKSARELSTSDAGSSYQQLLRRSGGARSSLVSLAKRGGGMPAGTPTPAAAPPPQSVPTPQQSRLSSFPIATSVDLTSVCATATDTPADALASDAEAPVVPAGHAIADAETISALRPLGACAADQDDDVVDVVAAAFHSNSLWDNVLPFELPGQVGRHGFQPIASDEEDEVYAHNRAAAAGPIEPLQPDWQPLHTALTLDELQALAQQPGGRDAGGNLRLAQARFRHLSRGTSQGGASDLALLSALTSGSLCGMPFDPETDEEPATAFAIIRRCGTRDRSSDRPASSTAATSSFGDLSRLLPAPAWRQAPSASDLPCPGRAAASTLAVAASVTSATTTAAAIAGQGPPPAEVVDSTASGYSANVWDQGTAPDQLSRARDSSFGSGAGGVRDSVIARDLTFGGALEVPERGGGDSAAAQLRNVLASLGGMHLIRGGSPVRPRYAAAGNSDSHASPQREPRNQHHVQNRRRGEAAAPHDGNSGRGGKTRRAAAGAASAAGNQRHKAAASKRTSAGALGTTGRAAAGGGKSRSTSRARGAKAHRAARGQPTAGRPPTGPQPPAPVLLQQQQLQHYPPPRPATPLPPPSPPPPQQSQTPVQFQMQLQLQQQQAAAASGVRRWTDSDPEDDDDDNDNEEEEEEMDEDEDEDQDALEDPSQETSASDCESAGNQSTPPRRQLHIRSPEDMPLSFVARQSAQPPRMGVMVDAAATRSTFIDGPPVMAVVAATAAAPTDGTLPSTTPGAWGPAYGSSGSLQTHRLRPGPAALGQRLRGVAYAPLPSHRWAAGRTYTTTSIHTDGTTTTTTTVVTSPVSNRGACQQDCTPNILSPPRNYDRPWATPTRNRNGVEMWAANDVNSGSGYVLPTRSDSPRPPGAMGQTDGGDRDGSSILGSPTTTGGRPGRITARPALVHSSPQRVQLQRGCGGAYDGGRPQPGLAEGEVTGAGAVAVDSRWGAPAGTSGLTNGIGTIHEEGPNGLTFAAPRSGHSMPAATTAAHRGPPNSAQVGLMFHRQPHFAERPSQLNAAASMAALNGNAAAMTPAAFPHGPGVGGVDAMPDGAAASAVGIIPARADRSQISSFGAGSSLGSQTATLPDTKAEGVQTDAFDTLNDNSFNASNRSGRRSSEGSRRPSSPTALITSRTDGGRGYNVSGGRGSGRPPMAVFRPSGSLRAAPAGTGGAQLALLHQAAWPGLRDPRVVDALATLEAGIAVLDPAPPPPPSSLGMTDLSEVSSGGGSSLPNGCFGLFNRSTPAVPKVPVVLVQEPVGQRPVLLRLHVADGAVELVLLRPRRGGGTNTSHGGPMGTHQPGAGEQRVRVAALSGLQPPLSAVLSPAAAAGANVFDDMADPSSRWVQLVAMDGGLMRLSACTPADHARLVLGLNAGLMAAMGAIGEETPLSVVPLCRGLGGVP
ncbi:hypothetical protein Vretimale_8471 [Volvox reticuliferus]|uniref:Uncharacterized protein n=1 Tax=Volvox reticuliferus TaxID=1737510 RepID=A0A8J4CL02_9CHLO|nr:hypothetical protein Vretifemale_11881 [Volvox reticuliferus]GIM03905.1 hypothetical protein Vretimale_8471 [Volvox reticuliferus]